ncbi:MAG TPA: threonine synthase [Pirellulaceae bacterium]|mgnify:CR=1 FL=1|nr:threonine synthase [Pirellulaceae bacterium]HMO91608.1 threonine synthase [Pirellulaceae bacterium]HMP68305.1 threonine synthase [Pirellulaceae bacterium]
MRFVTHLESAIDGSIHSHHALQTLHEGRPFWVRYDLRAICDSISKASLLQRVQGMYRYRELLPVGDEIPTVSLGETISPLIPAAKLGRKFGVPDLLIKDESQLPTGSFKSRGLSMAISMAQHFGVRRVAIPTAGNAGGAAALYAARAGIEAYVFMPTDTPIVNQFEAQLAGAHVFLVDGLINDCGKIVKEGKANEFWFDLSTLKEPYRIEGKKTMGLELAEQLQWRLPNVILYPTGGGTGLIGMWKAFNELKDIGWLESDTLPRMVAVQSIGCAPIAVAWDQGMRFAKPFPNARTIASGIRVPEAVGDFLILDALRESHGKAIAVAEDRLLDWQRMAVGCEGISICPETAACVGALEELAKDGWIQPHEKVVIFNTGAAQKYLPVQGIQLPRVDSFESVLRWHQSHTK